ncbi:MAG: hypothetical protein WA854_07505, partial [Candidatus Binataceae bacterium]
PGNVGALRAENSFRPEVIRLEPFDPPPARPQENGACGKPVAQLVLRALRPALEIEVMQSRGGPEFVRGVNLGARVVSIAGPWRRDGEWWKTPKYCTQRVQNFPRNPPLPPGEGNAASSRVGEGERPIAQGHSSPSPESRKARTEQPSPAGRGIRAQRVGEGAALKSDPAVAPNHSQNFSRAPLPSASKGSSPGRVPVAPPLPGEGSEKEERSHGFLRDYYELALDDGGVYRVFRDLDSERWFVDGVYD